MNVRYMVENGERLIGEGNYTDGETLLRMAEGHIKRKNPTGRNDLDAICCFTMIHDRTPPLIHCGDDDAHPLFPGTSKERKKLCHDCQQWCLERIKKLKSC